MKTIFKLALLLVSAMANSQIDTTFWRLTESFPAQENDFNLSIAADTVNEILYVGTSTGLYISNDEGRQWSPLFLNSPVFLIGIYESNLHLVGLEGMLYRSHDMGSTWDSLQLEGVSQINDMLILKNGNLFLATGKSVLLNDVPKFRGQGIFRSTDQGQSWQAVNNGIGDDRHVTHLVVDRQERMYAAVNEYNYHDGKLLYSVDEGNNWQAIPKTRFDWGDGSLDDSDVILFTNLSNLPNDDIVVAYNGAKLKAGTAVCLYNSFDSAMNHAPWTHMKLLEIGFPWQYNEPHNMYIARNGDIYANRIENSFIRGSVFYSNDSGKSFVRHAFEIVNYTDLLFAQCHYAEWSNGRLFAIQEFESRVYTTDQSMTEPHPTSVWDVTGTTEETINLFPNPAQSLLNIRFTGDLPRSVSIVNSMGKIIQLIPFDEILTTHTIGLEQFQAGIYLMMFQYENHVLLKKLLIE